MTRGTVARVVSVVYRGVKVMIGTVKNVMSRLGVMKEAVALVMRSLK